MHSYFCNSYFILVIPADESKQIGKIFHKSALVLTALAPMALMFAPASANTPIDYMLAIVVPFHSHVGLSHVITDYVPKAMRTMARSGLLGVSVIMFGGLMKLNVSGPGVTETVKALWRTPKNKE